MKKTRQPLAARIEYEVLPEGDHAGRARSDEDGSYKIVLPYGKRYGFLAEAESFVAIADHIDLRNVDQYREIQRDLYLVPLEVGGIVLLNNIFFDFDKSILRPESLPEVKRVANLLRLNASMTIEISGHTDDVGSIDHNKQLSIARAVSVRKKLIDLGIDPSRMKAVGFGETKPVAANNSDANRQLNRRVEFIILEK